MSLFLFPSVLRGWPPSIRPIMRGAASDRRSSGYSARSQLLSGCPDRGQRGSLGAPTAAAPLRLCSRIGATDRSRYSFPRSGKCYLISASPRPPALRFTVPPIQQAEEHRLEKVAIPVADSRENLPVVHACESRDGL